MTSAPYHKVNRQQVFQQIAKMIQESSQKEVEISSSDLADQFNVQAPTMDYHLNKLVEEGLLMIAPKRGRYNRKIYRLPSQSAEKTDVIKPEDTEHFKQFLQNYLQKKKQKPIEQGSLELEPVQESDELTLESSSVEVKELTLDERIEQFLHSAKQVNNAEMLLQHQDKEILSVINETIQQNIVYLKDLSEQLTTIQNKQLIQSLIDDRNRLIERNEHLEKEIQEVHQQAEQTKEEYEVDPNRVRFMHQLIISTIDDYVNLPNHALALNRRDFREKISKEVSDLVKYVLHLED